MFLNGLALVLTLLSAFVIVMNYLCAIANYRNKRRGIERHVSMVPLVPQILLMVADVSFFRCLDTLRWAPTPELVARHSCFGRYQRLGCSNWLHPTLVASMNSQPSRRRELQL